MLISLGDCLPEIDPVVSFDLTLKDIISKMAEYNRGFVILVNNGSPKGILTERDVNKLFSLNVSLNEPAINFANKNIVTAKPNISIYYGIDLLLENNIRRLVLVSDDGKYVGTVTVGDILRHLDDEALTRKIKVRDLKFKNVITINSDATLYEASRLMAENRISCLPVVDDNNLIGIITEKDIVKYISKGITEDKIGDLASKPVITVSFNDTLDNVLKLIKEKNIRHLVVLNENDKIAGILTQRDILRSLEFDYTRFLEKKLRFTKEALGLFPDPVIELVDTGNEQILIWGNQKAAEIFGNLNSKNIEDIIPEKEWSYIFYKLKKEGKVEGIKFNTENKYFELSGVYFNIEERDYKGRIKIVLKDITTEYEKNEKFKKELDILKKVINSTEDMMIIYQPTTGKLKLWNNAVRLRLGFTDDELKNKTIYDIVEIDRNILNENIQRILRKGEVIRGQRFYKNAYNNFLTVEIIATKVSFNGEDDILIVARDISDKLKMEEELRQKVKELSGIHEFILNLNRCHQEEEAYNLLSHTLIHKLGIDTVSIFKINPSLNRIQEHLVFGNGNYKSCLDNNPHYCKVFNSPQNFIVNSPDSYKCNQFCSDFCSYMCLSVVSNGKTIALLSLISKKEGFFTPEKVSYINDLINIFSPVLSNLRLIEINKELSIRDPLTGLYNRRFALEFMNKEIEKSKRNGKPLSIVMIDLDDFKKINDIHGHSAGDNILKIFSDVLKKELRKSDISCRWGGEEFLLILPETSKDKTLDVIERIRMTFQLNTMGIVSSRPYLTASMGIASYPEDSDNIDEIIKIADDRLYVAKREGKNRVVTH